MSEQSSLAVIQEMEINRLKEENESLRGSLEEWRLDFQSVEAQRDRLREAIETHRRDVWGDGPVEHDEDRELYAALEVSR